MPAIAPRQPHVVVEAIGADPAAYIKELNQCGLEAAFVLDQGPALDRLLDSARALLVVVGVHKRALAVEWVDAVWQRAVDAGTQVLVAVPSGEVNEYTADLRSILDQPSSKVGDLGCAVVQVKQAEPWKVALALVQVRAKRHRSGAPVVRGCRPPPEHKAMLQRAFGDFHRIEIAELVGGKTSSVYRVDALQLPAIRPLPFIAKVAERRKVVEEYDHFVLDVADFVPFQSRPNLIRERCMVGANSGILVGQFIEHSEALADAVVRVSSTRVMHEIFEVLLRGWWRQARPTAEPGARLLRGIDGWTDHAVRGERVAAFNKYHQEAATRHTGLLDPDELRRRLGAVALVHRRSLIHGDLHARNIHVRGNEAFLIDFGSVIEGPMLADAAMLEASLVLSIGVACTKKKSRRRWEEATRANLYGPGWELRLLGRDVCEAASGRIRRLLEAVRVIRLHVHGTNPAPGEYGALVASAYVRLASFDDSAPRLRPVCAPHLYVLACQIVAGLP